MREQADQLATIATARISAAAALPARSSLAPTTAWILLAPHPSSITRSAPWRVGPELDAALDYARSGDTLGCGGWIVSGVNRVTSWA